jgi:O-antigen/teichoic acid export membrane protein
MGGTPVGRVLIGLGEVAGYACNLAAGLRELGVAADVLDLQPGTCRFADNRPPTRTMRLLQRISRRRLATARSTGRRRLLAAAQALVTPFVLAQAIRRYDTFVFLFDTSFLRQRELPLLKLLRKRVVYVFCGSDDRPTYLDGGLMAAETMTIDACIRSVRRKKRMLRRVERHADVILSGPLRGLLHERPFVSFHAVGIPRQRIAPEPRTNGDGRVTVVHAPTHPVAKGTEVIRRAVDELHADGYEFDFEELQGVPNGELRERLRTCDFVVDQVWADTAMGGLPADAALYGKPSVVAGYGWEEVERLLPPDALAPSERCSPDGLKDAIVRLLVDEEHRLELGARARAFVDERWDATAVAQRLLDLLDGPPPEEWVHDPGDLRYVLGWGQPAERSLELVRQVFERAGPDALCLRDKPAAEAALLELAFGERTDSDGAASPVPAPARGLRSLLADSAAYGLGLTVLPAALLLATPLVARRLGPVGFGAIDLLTTILTLASVATLLGIDAGLTRSYFDHDGHGREERRRTMKTALVSVLASSGAAALALSLIAFACAEALGTTPSSTSLAAIVAAFALLPLTSALAIARVALRLERRRRLFTTIAAVQGLLGVAAAVTFVVLGAGPAGYFAGLALGAVAALLVFLRTPTGGTFLGGAVLDRAELAKMLRYGLPLVPAALASWTMFAVDRTLLASMRGLHEVGYYALASKLAAPLFLLLNAFAAAWIPFILGQADRRRLELRARAMTAVTAATGIGFVALLLAAPWLVHVVGGPAFHRSLDAVPGLALGWLAWGVAFVLSTGFMVSRRTRVVAAVTGASAAANIILNVILIPTFGFVGAAWASAATFVLLAAAYFVAERRTTRIPYRWGRLSLVAIVLAAAAAVLVPADVPLGVRLAAAVAAVAILAGIATTDRERPGRGRKPVLSGSPG